MKAILYGHAWMSGALTAFAFFGLVRAFNDITQEALPSQIAVWASVVAVGLLWALLGFSYVAARDWEGGGAKNLEAPAPAAGAPRPAEQVGRPSGLRGSPVRYGGPLLMLLAFLVVIVLLAGAVGGWWTITTRPPRPFIPPTPPRGPCRRTRAGDDAATSALAGGWPRKGSGCRAESG